MPTRLCIDPTCLNVATYRGRCQRHATERERTITRAGYKIYRTARWRHTRDRYLFLHSLCEQDGCDRIATDVHHIKDLADGGDPYSASNLQALCHQHHSKITRRNQHAS